MVATLLILVWAGLSAVVALRCGVLSMPPRGHRAADGPGPPSHSLRRLGLLSLAGLLGWQVMAWAAVRLAGFAAADPSARLPWHIGLTSAATAVVAAGLLLGLRRGHGQGPPSGRLGVVTGAGQGLLGLLIVLPWVYLTLAATLAVLTRLGVDVEPTHETLRRLTEARSPVLIALLLVSTAIVTPTFEEVLFRGAIQSFCVAALEDPKRPGARWPRWGGILVASMVFAGLHATWSIPAIFVLSLGLGYLYDRTGRLWPPVVMHAVFNSIALTQTLLSREGSSAVG